MEKGVDELQLYSKHCFFRNRIIWPNDKKKKKKKGIATELKMLPGIRLSISRLELVWALLTLIGTK